MANEHLRVIQSGVRYNQDLKALSNSAVGNKDHPRGAVLNAFNRAKTALAGNWDNPLAMAIILEEYRATVLTAVREASGSALAIGEDHANLMLDTWGLPSIDESQTALIDQGVSAADAVLMGQIRAIESGTLTEAQVLGGPRRVGLFAAGVVMGAVNNWLITSAAKAVGGKISQGFERGAVSESQYHRQAVAAIDENTTDCCLAVHGQLVEMKGEFYTPENPAWATYQERPPFHRFCRTSQVLVRKGAGLDDITNDMELAAYLERQARTKPGYVAPHPANAFTRVRSGRGIPFVKPTPIIPSPKKTTTGDTLDIKATKPGEYGNLTIAKMEMQRKWGITAIDDFDDLPDHWQDAIMKEGHGKGLYSTSAQKLNQLNQADIELTWLSEKFPGFRPELDDFSIVPDGRGAAWLNRQYDFLQGRSIMTIKFKDWPSSSWDDIEDYLNQGLKAPITASRRGKIIGDNFRHELAHVKTTKGFEAYWMQNVNSRLTTYKPGMAGHFGSAGASDVTEFFENLYDGDWFYDNVSTYSKTSMAEEIAESFSVYTRTDYIPGTLPHEIEMAMEIMTNQRELPQVFKSLGDF